MKRLLAIGDSHTFGAEIFGPDDYREESKNFAYPAVLGNLLSFDEVINLGISGASIMRTERMLVEHLSRNPKPDLVVIGWTVLGRMEYCTGVDNDGNFQYHMMNSWRSPDLDLSNTSDPMVRDFIRYHELCTSEDLLCAKYRTIILCQNLLENLGIPYIMFEVMSNTKFNAPLSGGTEVEEEVCKNWKGDRPLEKSLYSMINKNNYMENDSDAYWDYLFYNDLEGVEIIGGHANAKAHEYWAAKLQQELINREIYKN